MEPEPANCPGAGKRSPETDKGLHLVPEGREGNKAPSHQESQAGKTFVITGTLSKPRIHFKNLIVQHGGKVAGSISSRTDYLLCGVEAGFKLDKAKKLGIEIIDEVSLSQILSK